jgi:nicotinamidase-related amidase
MKQALIVVDMQNDFVFGALGSDRARGILSPLKERLDLARKNGEEVVFTRDTHEKDYLSTQEGKKLPVEHCIKGSNGWQIVEGLYEQGEKVFDKPVFGSVALATHVRDGGFSRVELVGVCTDICVVSNALLLKANFPEAEISVDSSCCAGVTPASHQAALTTMGFCQINVL